LRNRDDVALAIGVVRGVYSLAHAASESKSSLPSRRRINGHSVTERQKNSGLFIVGH
jgi:hypothetical protein